MKLTGSNLADAVFACRPRAGQKPLGGSEEWLVNSGMHPAVAVGVYFAFVFLGGALLAPWIFKLVSWGVSFSSLFQDLAHHPFPRFVNRSFIALAMLGLWPFVRTVGLRSRAALGLPRRVPDRWRLLGMGLGIGFVSLLVAAVLVVLAGGRSVNANHTLAASLEHIANAGLAAAVVGVLEEIFFRGAIFGALRKSFEWSFALFLASATYAVVHFLDRAAPPKMVTWTSGLASLGQMLRGFTEVSHWIPAFFCLLLAGWILGLAYQRTGSLYFSIGLHAGWIFWVKSYAFLTQENPEASAWIWGSGKLIDGWIALVILAAVLVAVRWFSPVKQERPAPGLLNLTH